MNLIAADIGNSTISIGIAKGIEIDLYRINTHPLLRARDYTDKFTRFMDISNVATIEGGVICSVVPEATPLISEAIREVTGSEPLVVDNSMDMGMEFEVHNRETLGTDRMASAVGAMSIADPPVIVVDFGTATTINVIEADKDGKPVYKGGAIMPGLRLMGEALEGHAAQLPRVAHNGTVSLPGKTTESSILAGITYATAGGIERIIEEIEQDSGLKYRVMVTGGMLEYGAAFIRRPTKRQPALTLRGLLRLHSLSRAF